MLPRKSTKAAKINLNLETPMSEDQGDVLAQAKPVGEKEKPTIKEKVQKQVEAAKLDEDKVKGNGNVEGSMPIEKKKTKHP